MALPPEVVKEGGVRGQVAGVKVLLEPFEFADRKLQ